MVYFDDRKGIRVSETYLGKTYEFSVKIDDAYHVVIPCSLYIAPTMKKTYGTRTGRDLLKDALEALVNDVPEVRDPHITRGTIRFGFVGPSRVQHRDPRLYDAKRDFSRKIAAVLRTRGAAWHEICKPVEGLQGVLLDLLRDPEYKFRSFVHFASRHGAEEAFRVRGLMDAWS